MNHARKSVDAPALARRLIKQRREREALLGTRLLGEPVWDMLLDLYVAHAEGKPVSVTSLCIASNVPPSTALRWVSAMEEDGMILRESDAKDGRRSHLRLTPRTAAQMETLLRSWSD